MYFQKYSTIHTFRSTRYNSLWAFFRTRTEFFVIMSDDIFSFVSLSCSWNPARQRLARSVCWLTGGGSFTHQSSTTTTLVVAITITLEIVYLNTAAWSVNLIRKNILVYVGHMFKMLRKEKQYDSSLKIAYGIIIWSSNSALDTYLEEWNQGLNEIFVQPCT